MSVWKHPSQFADQLPDSILSRCTYCSCESTKYCVYVPILETTVVIRAEKKRPDCVILYDPFKYCMWRPGPRVFNNDGLLIGPSRGSLGSLVIGLIIVTVLHNSTTKKTKKTNEADPKQLEMVL